MSYTLEELIGENLPPAKNVKYYCPKSEKQYNAGSFGTSGDIYTVIKEDFVSNQKGIIVENYSSKFQYFIPLSELERVGILKPSPKIKSLDECYVVKCKNLIETTIVANYIKNQRFDNHSYYKYVINHNGVLHDGGCKKDNNIYSIIPEKAKNFPILSFEEWTEIKNQQEMKQKTQENMENKEIIGYNFVKTEYSEALWKILECNYANTFEENRKKLNRDFGLLSIIFSSCKKAGILEAWCEPVYKQKEEIVSMGSFNLTVKGNKVFHNTEDITDFVVELVEFYQRMPRKFHEYDCIISEVTFSKTGCQNNTTHLSDWKRVYDKIKSKQ